MKQATKEKRQPDYLVVVDFQVIDNNDNNTSEHTILTNEFELLYERMGYHIKEKEKKNDCSGIMVFADQDRPDNQNLRKKCRDLMEGRGNHPRLRFKMSGGLNIQEEANGLNFAKKITKISVKGLQHILNKNFKHTESQEFKALPFRKDGNSSILGIGITSCRSWRGEIEGVLEDFFEHEWANKKDSTQ